MDTLDRHVFNVERLADVDVVTVSGDLSDRSVKLVMGVFSTNGIVRVLEMLRDTNTTLRFWKVRLATTGSSQS